MDVRILKSSDIGRCPKMSLLPAHFRDDGTCRCDEREQARTEVAEADEAARQAQADLQAAYERLRRT